MKYTLKCGECHYTAKKLSFSGGSDAWGQRKIRSLTLLEARILLSWFKKEMYRIADTFKIYEI